MMNEDDNVNDGKNQQGWSRSMFSVHSWQDHAGQSDSALKLLPPGHVKAAVKLALTGGNWSIGGMGRTTVSRVLHGCFTNILSKVHIYTYIDGEQQITCYSIFSHLFQASFHDVHHWLFHVRSFHTESQALTIDHGPCRLCALRRHGVVGTATKDTVWAGMTRYPSFLKVLLGPWGNKPKERVFFFRKSKGQVVSSGAGVFFWVNFREQKSSSFFHVPGGMGSILAWTWRRDSCVARLCRRRGAFWWGGIPGIRNRYMGSLAVLWKDCSQDVCMFFLGGFRVQSLGLISTDAPRLDIFFGTSQSQRMLNGRRFWWMPSLLLAHSLHALACIVIPESVVRKRQIFFTHLSEYCTFGMMSVRRTSIPSHSKITIIYTYYINTYMYTIQINVGLIKCNYNIYIYIVYIYIP